MIRTAVVVAGSVLALVAPLSAVAHAPAAPTDHPGHAAHAGAAEHASPPESAEPATLATRSVAPRAQALPRLRGQVGPSFTITISRHRVVRGRYRIVVQDESSMHNWHISGPGIDRATSVSGTGRTVWRVRLRPGRYLIRCDPHSDQMRTRLRVVRG